MTSIIVLPGAVRFWMEVTQGVVLDPAEPWISPNTADLVYQNARQKSDVANCRFEEPSASTRRRVWVREDDGQESAHDLNTIDADLRVGHSVGLLYGAVAGVRQGPLLGALNLTTGGFSCSDAIDARRLKETGLISAYGSWRRSFRCGIPAGAVVVSLGCLFVDPWPALMAGVAVGATTALLLAWKGRRSARRMIPYVNQRALHVLLSRCDLR